MTTKNVEHFKITATTSAHWVIPARTQEEYKQKKKFSPRPHAHSHAFRHIRTLTHMTVSTHAYLHSSHTSWEKNSSSCTTLKKKLQCKTSFYLKRVREVCVCVSKWKKECQTNGKHSKRKSQAQWKEKYRKGRGPFRQSSHCHPDKRKRERLSTKSTHVTVYLFRDLNRDRSRLLWMTVGPKGQYSAKRRSRNRHRAKRSNVEVTSIVDGRLLSCVRRVLSYTWHRERHVELLVMYDQTFGTRTLLAHVQRRRKEKKKKSKLKKGRKIIREKCDPTVQISVSMR